MARSGADANVPRSSVGPPEGERRPISTSRSEAKPVVPSRPSTASDSTWLAVSASVSALLRSSWS